MKKLVEFMAANACFSICDLVCNGHCTAIDSFTMSGNDVCKLKISSFLKEHLEVEDMNDGLFEMSKHTYRKRPIEVEAIRFTRSNFDNVKEFTGGKAKSMFIERCPNGKCTCVIETPNGDMVVDEGDFIIYEFIGTYSVCKANVFFKSYDLVEDS